jgi:hypothetical protein
MDLEITPEPSDAERAAIAAALEEEPVREPSPWPGAVLPAPQDSLEP